MSFEFRLASGWITAAALNAGAYLLDTDFPIQSDQSPFLQPWGPPIDHKEMYPRRQRAKVNADFSQTFDGFWQWDWVLAFLTEGMVSYFETTFYPYFTGSTLVTAKTIKRNGVYGVYQGTMLYPEAPEYYDPSERGIENYKLRFRGMTAL